MPKCRTVKDSNSSSKSPTTVGGRLGRDSIFRGSRSMETVAKAMLGAAVVVVEIGLGTRVAITEVGSIMASSTGEDGVRDIIIIEEAGDMRATTSSIGSRRIHNSTSTITLAIAIRGEFLLCEALNHEPLPCGLRTYVHVHVDSAYMQVLSRTARSVRRSF